MATLTPIKGIYYSVGSKDVPHGFNPNNNYGFEGNDPDPVFSYSLTNVDNFFYKPLVCRRLRNAEIQTLIVESAPATGLEGLSSQEFIDNGVEALYEALNILYDRSDIVDPDFVYDSKGDRLLSEASLQDRYKAGSLYIELATISSELRISLVKFKFRLFDNVEHTSIYIYFIPDVMFDEEGFDEGRYSISYTTKNIVNDESGLASILVDGPDSLLHFEDNRNYTNVCKFTTPFNVLSENGNTILDTYDRTFFIHNVMYRGYELTVFQKIIIIKKYLDYKYIAYGDSRRIILNKEYPELFTANSVDIFPMMTPRVEGVFSSIVSNDVIRSEIQRRGVTIDLDNEDSASRVEIIMLEGKGIKDSNNYSTASKANRNFLAPLMVLSNDPTSYSGVIYDTFRSFAPTFTGYMTHGELWEQFHFFLKLIIKLATGVLPWNYSGLADGVIADMIHLPSHMQLSTNRVIISESEFINDISFDFMDITYTVHNFFKYGVV